MKFLCTFEISSGSMYEIILLSDAFTHGDYLDIRYKVIFYIGDTNFLKTDVLNERSNCSQRLSNCISRHIEASAMCRIQSGEKQLLCIYNTLHVALPIHQSKTVAIRIKYMRCIVMQ